MLFWYFLYIAITHRFIHSSLLVYRANLFQEKETFVLYLLNLILYLLLYLMNSFHCFQPVKSSGELKSRGVKLLPGKDNTNKLSLSKSFIFLMQLFLLFIHILLFNQGFCSGSLFISVCFFASWLIKGNKLQY